MKEDNIVAQVISKDVITGQVTERDYTQKELDNIVAAEAEELPNKLIQDAFDAQVESEKASLPTRAEVKTMVDDIANLADAKVFIKKLAMVVYTLRKNSTD